LGRQRKRESFMRKDVVGALSAVPSPNGQVIVTEL
jgi:hypothetical protein